MPHATKCRNTVLLKLTPLFYKRFKEDSMSGSRILAFSVFQILLAIPVFWPVAAMEVCESGISGREQQSTIFINVAQYHFYGEFFQAFSFAT